MATKTVYRKADISPADARKTLSQAFPGTKFTLVPKIANATEALAAKASEGDLVYEATVHLAEFPPSDDEGSDGPSSDGGDDSAPEPSEEDKGGDDKPSSDDASESGSSDDKGGDKPPFGKDKGEGGKKPSVEEAILHTLEKILHAVDPTGGAGGLGGPDAGLGGPPGPPGLPDIGAPGQGEGLPAPGGPGGAPPLPPPVPEKKPLGGGSAFAHYDQNQAEVSTIRREASELGNRAMIAEAAQFFPTHKVARIQRTGYARINGEEIYLPEANAAVVTLTRK